MYFNPQVKEKKEDFYNYEVLQNELQQAVGDKLAPLIAVHGLRRTGKTSLIRVVLNGLGKKYVWIDGREISSLGAFQRKLFEEAGKMQRIRLRKVALKGIEIDLNIFKEGLDYLNKKRAIIVVDEAQLLKAMRLDRTVAYIYDNFPGIKLILSGSESGRLLSFLGKNNAQAPLYGRAITEIETHRLDKERGLLFLKQGAEQAKIKFNDEELREAISKLDGIIGWLTKYGWYRIKYPHKESLRRTIAEGKLITREEFNKFSFRAERKYGAIIRRIKGGAGWEELKKQVGISDKQLSSMLRRLIDGGFVEKSGGIYTLTDPLLGAAL